MQTEPDVPSGVKALMDKVQAYHRNLANAERELARTEVEAESAEGMVRVVMSGMGELRHIHIDPRIVTAVAPEHLGHYVLETIRAAAKSAGELAGQLTGRPVDITPF
jgi:DNA-binding YbaB/EbfC family protein